ncbi:hypothetical protein [Ramlibacter sp.]|nr:hypothetical protein [Ramlibacter sp.]MDB5955931.1 hypothetical protein [Ramlibacter sp.]
MKTATLPAIRWNGELLPDRPALEQKLGAVAAQADPEDACGIPTGISG